MSIKSKKSESGVGLAKAKWTRNFKKTTTLRPNIPVPETKARARYHQIKTLSYAETKSGAYRIKRISEEINFRINYCKLFLNF